MIKPAFLKAQTLKSRQMGQTSLFLRRLIFSTVDRLAKNRYGEDYPIRCLQTSVAVQSLLASLGIRSELWLGALCAAGPHEDPTAATWAGFWGQDHHVWLRTEFNELVDLSVSQLHLHPRSIRDDGIAMPPVWWDDIGGWPPIIRYLPDSRIGEVSLPAPDETDLAEFRTDIMVAFGEQTKHARVDQITFGPILDNVDTMNRLTAQGHPWLVGALAFLGHGVSFPPWIQAREAELNAAYKLKIRAPSQLAPQVDAIHTRNLTD